MRNLIYAIAIILVIGWAIGVFVYAASGLIHILLVMAVVVIIARFIRR
jgi:hypothetical protein